MRNVDRTCPPRLSWLIGTLLFALPCPAVFAEGPLITPASMARIGTVDDRFQSYNVEMVEVTGGAFWKPYGSDRSPGHSELYESRPPIDLTNPKLRKLAAALAPAYLRVSGSWANATYFGRSGFPTVSAVSRDSTAFLAASNGGGSSISRKRSGRRS